MNFNIPVNIPVDPEAVELHHKFSPFVDKIAYYLASDSEVQIMLEELGIRPTPSHYWQAGATVVTVLQWLDLRQGAFGLRRCKNERP